MKKLFDKLINRETILYLVFGVLTTAVNYVVFWLLFRAAGPNSALWVNAIAFVVAVTFAYITNKLYVFESRSWQWSILKKEISTFVAARLLSFGIEEFGLMAYAALAPAGLRLLGMDGTLLVKLLLNVFVILFNYIASKLIIFKKK